MISFWIEVEPQDVEAFASTLVLPSYTAHLSLTPFSFASQGLNRDGLAELTLTYEGPGRVEDVRLAPAEHALDMIRFLCASIDPTKIGFSEGDAVWHWPAPSELSSEEKNGVERMRIYFTPTEERLNAAAQDFSPSEAYVSLTRAGVFIGRSIVERYVNAWLQRLGLKNAEAAIPAWENGTSGGVRFVLAPLGGELLVDSEPMIADLLQFAGLDGPLAALDTPVKPETLAQGGPDLRPDGLFFLLPE